MVTGNYPGITSEWDEVIFPQEVRKVVNNIINGKTNNTGTFTVSSGTTTTVVSDIKATANSVIMWCALDATSADTSTFYVSNRDTGTFTITHNSVGSDREYAYAIIA